MKLKRIKDNEIVVDKYEYARLVRLENRLQSAYKDVHQCVNPVFIKYIDQETDKVFVVMNAHGFYMSIKCFNSDDLQYNLLCAEELVELLNKEQ